MAHCPQLPGVLATKYHSFPFPPKPPWANKSLFARSQCLPHPAWSSWLTGGIHSPNFLPKEVQVCRTSLPPLSIPSCSSVCFPHLLILINHVPLHSCLRLCFREAWPLEVEREGFSSSYVHVVDLVAATSQNTLRINRCCFDDCIWVTCGHK